MATTTSHLKRAGARSAVIAVGLAVSMTLLTGCGSNTKADPAPSASPSKSASTDPAAADKAKVLAAVKGMHEAQAAAYAKGTEKDSHLQAYAQDKALSGIRVELFSYQQAGIVFQGAPQLSNLQVTAIDLQQSPKKATVQGCIDTSHWTPVKKNGDKVPVKDSNRRYVISETARTIGNTWYVVAYQLDKSRPC
ncbi:hypothetical protein ACWGCW_28050 [Streptomyces sp. NPDC054933]